MKIAASILKNVARYDPNDQSELFAFRRSVFGEQSRQADIDGFKWLHGGHGPSSDPRPEVWLYKRNGVIVGQQAAIPFSLKIANRTVPAAWAVDLFVLPQYRLTGAGPALITMHAANKPVTVALGVSDAARKAYDALGWTPIGVVPNYVWAVQPERLLPLLPFHVPFAKAAGWVARHGGHMLDAVVRTRISRSGTAFTQLDRFDDWIDQLWASVSPHYPILATRDLAAVDWRFARDARHKRYHLERNGKIVGYAVMRIDRWQDEPFALLIDYLAAPSDVPILFAHCLQMARREGAIAFIAKTANAMADLQLRAMGFLRLSKPPFWPTLAYAHVASGASAMTPFISKLENWFITMADSDISLDPLDIRRQHWTDSPRSALEPTRFQA